MVYTPNHLLRKAREQRNWTHKDVADMIGLPDSHTVGRWERGVTFPRPHYRRELCRIFELSPEELGLIPGEEPEPEAEAVEVPQHLATAWKPPAFLTSFVGREQDIAELCTLIMQPEVRLVTLLGPGGVGKTRLCLQVAEQLREHFPDGACFVPLASIQDPTVVVSAIAKALDIPQSETQPLPELVKTFLRSRCLLHTRCLLLVLDNVEQVSSASPFLEELLAECPQIKVLVTSRAVLRIQAEYTFSVAPLALPPERPLEPEKLLEYASVELFVQRVRAVDHRFQLTPENAPLVAEICQRLDGLPLALELAAARTRHLSLHGLATRLSSRFQVLKSEQRTVPERQRTLRSALKWSYDLLNEQEQRLFRWLAVFNGGCTLEAIAAICIPHVVQEEDLLDLIASLHNQSFLYQAATDVKDERYIMLESIREYGMDCLQESGELEQCQRAHASYYLALVERAQPHLKGAGAAEWLASLDGELENLRMALNWLIEHHEAEQALRFTDAFGKFCGLRGYWTEEMRWLQIVLALPSLEYTTTLGRVLRRAAHLAYRLRDLTSAQRWYKEGEAISRKVGDTQNLAGILLGLGRLLARQKDIAAATRTLRESVRAARDADDAWSLANALEGLANFLHGQGEVEEARQLAQESVMLARQRGDNESLVRFLKTLTEIELARGDVAQAAQLAQECFACAQALNTRPTQALALDNLAKVALFQGENDRAIELLNRRREIARELTDVPALIARQLALAEILLLQGDASYAASSISEGLRFFREQGDNPNIAWALRLSGDVKRLQKDYDQAIAFYKEALRVDYDMGSKKYMARQIVSLAKAAAEQQRFELAALLGGCAEPLLSHSTMYPAQKAEYQRLMQEVASQLGTETFASTWAKGRALPVEEIFHLV